MMDPVNTTALQTTHKDFFHLRGLFIFYPLVHFHITLKFDSLDGDAIAGIKQRLFKN